MKPTLVHLVLVLVVAMTPAAGQSPLQPGFQQTFLEDVDGRTRAWGLAVADFTSDGVPDIVSGDTFGDVHLLEGRGDGVFDYRGVVINRSFHDAYAVTAADFDRDGFQDIVLIRTGGSATGADDGLVELYPGNGDGTFDSNGFPQAGIPIGDAGTDAMVLAAADVDGDGDVDILAGDVAASSNGLADVTLYRNGLEVQGGALTWTPEIVVEGVDRGFSPDPEDPPYFPPTGYLQAYGLALGDVDNDGDPDLLLTDIANYLYVYRNDGSGTFSPIRYENISTRPFAFGRLHANFTFHSALAAGDLNGDGWTDFATAVRTGDNGDYTAELEVWINAGLDALGRPDFTAGAVAGSAGTDPRGLAIGQLDPALDLAPDVVFGNYEGDLWGLFADLTDTDNDGIIDDLDNAPTIANPPVLDMNTDGGLNRLDQLDADADGIGDPADADDDDDLILDVDDNCPLVPNGDQSDTDADGRGDACDPLNDLDFDGDGVADGPLDPALLEQAIRAKARWAQSDTHFIVRIDALGRAFQNEFTQTMVDAAVLSPGDWEAKKFDNYNGIGDSPALPGYQVPADLPGGLEVPVTIVVIPKLLFAAFGDPDPIHWINDRNESPYLEIGQHGTYHVNNTPLGDWATMPDRNFFSCETCGFDVPTMQQYLRVGTRTLLGEYASDPWILDSGVDPVSGPRVDWSDAANPLISYAPPYNTSDTASRDAVARLGFVAFSASIFEENSPIFTPEGSHHEAFDQFGMFHASADRQVDPEAPGESSSYEAYLASITDWGTLNTWLIEEVEWSTRYCNELERLAPCGIAPGGVNRENNMVDAERWERWLTLLEFVAENGTPMTLGDYALAVATDNCPALENGDQSDVDADGVGDPCDVERIDVKPGSDEASPINVTARGVIPVAIPGTELIDVRDIDIDTLSFGPAGAAPAHRGHLVDVDEDGITDLLLHFWTQETGVEAGDLEICLEGQIGMTLFVACDDIVTVPPGRGRTGHPLRHDRGGLGQDQTGGVVELDQRSR